MKSMDWIVLTLLVVGALNWGLIGFFQFDLITTLFHGSLGWISRILFAIVGLAGLYGLTLYGHMDQDEKVMEHSRR